MCNVFRASTSGKANDVYTHRRKGDAHHYLSILSLFRVTGRTVGRRGWRSEEIRATGCPRGQGDPLRTRLGPCEKQEAK